MSASNAAIAAASEHVHHPNADKSASFTGYAAFEISHCGICGSDVHGIDSALGPAPYPCILGHEIIGRVVAVGSAVTNVAVGDRVGVGAQCHACLNKNSNCPECKIGRENHCRNEMVWSIISKYQDGQVTQGGWADRVRVDGKFAFKIPAAISSAEAAPLMCGGVTVFAPLQRALKTPGMQVGIIGVGGLGHMAIKFASKMLGGDVKVTAISQSSRKKADALAMGATDFIDTSDPAQVKAAFRRFDYILSTANGSNMDVASWLSMVAYGGAYCTVGLPELPMSIHAFHLLGAQISVTASGIGSIQDMKDMLNFAAEHNVRPIIQTLPMSQVNDGIKKVRDGSVRYRVVLENPTR